MLKILLFYHVPDLIKHFSAEKLKLVSYIITFNKKRLRIRAHTDSVYVKYESHDKSL